MGYDTRDGAYATALYERYNLLPGIFGGLELRGAEEMLSLNTYAYAKGALGSFDIGIDAGLRRVKGDDYGFTHKRFTFEPYIAKDLAPGLRSELGIGYRSDRVEDVRGDALRAFASETGQRNGAYLRAQLDYKAPATPEAAFTWGGQAVYKLFGLGERDKVAELGLNADAELKFAQHYSLGLRASGGMVKGLNGARLRTTDRFTPGGAEFRGFANRGIGPAIDGWRVGGDRYAILSVDVQRDIGEIFGSKAKAGVFVDAGSVWGGLDGRADSSRKWRSSAGASLTLDLSGVPVSAYIAKPIKSYAGDKEQSFGLTVRFLR